ncbi:MAG: hypothetical protein ACLPM8_14795 [Myxococcaceae bacterium]
MKTEVKRLRAAGLLLALVVSFPAVAGDAKTITFDPPGAAGGSAAVSINLFGVIAGQWVDEGGTAHGYLRAPNGTFTSFDPPESIDTLVQSINLEGATTGYYYDASFNQHGFIRTPSGAYVSFDAPGDVDGINPFSINQFGETTGTFWDLNNTPHGFVRYPNGTLTVFDAPGADQGTLASGLNAAGAISGDYHASAPVSDGYTYRSHGFLRAPDGAILSFDVPGAGDTYGSGVNDQGAITGIWVVAHGDVEHGYVRSPDGKFTTFDAPGAGTGTGGTPGNTQQGTEPSFINGAGEVVGDYFDDNSVYHGFLRLCDGKVITFDAPGAGTTPYAFQGTVPLVNNLWGAIVGYSVDNNGVLHSFLRQ